MEPLGFLLSRFIKKARGFVTTGFDLKFDEKFLVRKTDAIEELFSRAGGSKISISPRGFGRIFRI